MDTIYCYLAHFSSEYLEYLEIHVGKHKVNNIYMYKKKISFTVFISIFCKYLEIFSNHEFKTSVETPHS